MRRKRNLERLLPEDTKKEGSKRATSELYDRVETISKLAEEFFSNVTKRVEEITERVTNLEEDIEQVIEALMKAEGVAVSSSTPGAKATPGTPATPTTPTTPSAPSVIPPPGTAPAAPSGGVSTPQIGGSPSFKVKQGGNAPKF